jgi:Lon protease-like protein
MTREFEIKDFNGKCRLFPLPGIVLFPGAILPLHIFEPRYRQLTVDALATDGLVTIVQTKRRESQAIAGEPEFESIGSVGKIVQYERLVDGRFNYLLLGCKRVRLIREIATDTLYRIAEGELLDDCDAFDPFAPAPSRDELVALFRIAAEKEESIDPELAKLLNSNAPLGTTTDLLAHALSLPASVKQELLAERRVAYRAQALIEQLSRLVGPIARSVIDRRAFPPKFSDN